MIIRARSHARAGLIGNPSDGYFGKTISFLVRNFTAEVTLWESPRLEILPAARDHSVFEGIGHLASDVRHFGYYGGIRLLKATVKRFHDYCMSNGQNLDNRNFTLCYSSDIPPQVGMAGSSAIITAALRALMEFYGVEIPLPVLPNLILSVEKNELKIPAGLQDRVIQAYGGVVFMDFDEVHMREQGHGIYESIDPSLLPPLYVAYTTRLSEGTEVFHNDIRSRWENGDPEVRAAMRAWAGLAAEARDLLLAGRGHELGPLLDANFDLRKKIYRISAGNLRMVEIARSIGASAKFTGSGGAIVGTYRDQTMFRELVAALAPEGIQVIQPDIG
jgi:glucuronokinase